MEIITKLISKETIKPSSPTPKSLQKHHLSFLDQSMPPIYLPFVYFYESNPKIPNSEKSNHLKKSLSKILSRFYPLAGRHVGNLYVDCNDGGAPFLEAEADCDLSQAIPLQNPKILNSLLPYKTEELRDFCMAVQATYFRCGGLAVAILISHKIADSVSSISFVNAWSGIAKNVDGGGTPPPKFDAAVYFPPLTDTSVLDPTATMAKEEITTRIFRFPAAAISLLQERYSGGGGGERPSRMEALSAFIWTRFISATGTRSDPDKIYYLHHTIDLRNRVDLQLTRYDFGNIVGVSTVKPATGDGGFEVVQKIKGAVKAVDNGYVAHSEIDEHPIEKEVRFSFSSLSRFPFYEANFGWGRPVWVGLGEMPYKNIVYFMDTDTGGEIEAFIQLSKQDMEKFTPHLELQILKSKL